MNKIDIFSLLKDAGELKYVKLYPGYATENDPTEHTQDVTLLNPITVKAIIADIGFSGLKWKYFSQLPAGSKQIIAEPIHKNLFLSARQITIDNENYGIYQDADGTFQILERRDYIIVILKKTL